MSEVAERAAMTTGADHKTGPGLPPLDSSVLDFDVDREIRRTVVDLMRGAEPTTILGLLLANSEGIRVADIARRLEMPESLVSWNLDKLESEDLCVRVENRGVVRAHPLAAYTWRNE